MAYLTVGTCYARANSQRCYEAAVKKWSTSSTVSRSYHERLTVYVLMWPLVLPTNFIASVVTAPVGDLETAYQCWQGMQEQINLGRKELR